MTKIAQQFGTWNSPITTDLLTQSSNSLVGTYADKVAKTLYLIQGRPAEKGRRAVLETNSERLRAPEIKDRMAETINANCSTSVHEYGGGALAALGGTVIYCDQTTKNLFLKKAGESPKVLFDSSTYPRSRRFADFDIHPSLRYVVCVSEEHFGESSADIVNTLCVFDLETLEVREIVKGLDFYSSARFSAQGDKLVWIGWNHPNMPWSHSSMFTADYDGTVKNTFQIPANDNESVSYPAWLNDDEIIFISDKSGWTNFYHYSFGKQVSTPIVAMEAEFGSPPWTFQNWQYDIADAKTIICSYVQNGSTVLATIDIATKALTSVTDEFTVVTAIRVIEEEDQKTVYFLGNKIDKPNCLYAMNLNTKETTIVCESLSITLDNRYVSAHQNLTFKALDGTYGHMIYYPPQNLDYEPLPNELPPCLFHCHGGPTSHASPGFSLAIQYWTSRGFAYVDVNYGGSSNYGRAYRERLDGKWGIVDVDDICQSVKTMIEKKLADPKRVFIDGGSAGGYTVLACLTFQPEVFTAGTSLYGICDMESLAKLTHKFEAHYLKGLIGGDIKDIPEIYKARSPIHYVDHIKAPVLILQGADDKVVPPNQSELIVNAIKAKGGRVEYKLFEGEGHGFRKAESIKKAFESELAFYQSCF